MTTKMMRTKTIRKVTMKLKMKMMRMRAVPTRKKVKTRNQIHQSRNVH